MVGDGDKQVVSLIKIISKELTLVVILEEEVLIGADIRVYRYLKVPLHELILLQEFPQFEKDI